jgi:hypothetical protein
MHISISRRADTIDGVWFKIRRASLLGPDGGGRSTKHAATVVDAKMADENGVAVVHATDADSGGTVYGHMDF